MAATRPSFPGLSTRGLSSLGQMSDTGSPAEQRDDAKKNMLKAMRPLPTQHYWNVYFDRLVQSQSLKNIVPLGRLEEKIPFRSHKYGLKHHQVLENLQEIYQELNLSSETNSQSYFPPYGYCG